MKINYKMFVLFIPLICLLLFSCGNKELNREEEKSYEVETETPTKVNLPPSFSWELLETIPHDITAYTQGLEYYDDYLYESTGHYGQSTIRKINPETGKILKKESIPESYFGEGLTIFEDKIYMLTWESRLCLIINLESFKIEDTFSYRGEGWGLTHDEKNLIMSDGTNLLRYIDPATKQVVKTLPVSYNSRPVSRLNELEYIEGKIWANLYGEDRIAVIDPTTGAIENVIDFSELRTNEKSNPYAEVFNGIAYNKNTQSIYLTGKNWSGFSRVKIN